MLNHRLDLNFNSLVVEIVVEELRLIDVALDLLVLLCIDLLEMLFFVTI